jgi:hypothetical protein
VPVFAVAFCGAAAGPLNAAESATSDTARREAAMRGWGEAMTVLKSVATAN